MRSTLIFIAASAFFLSRTLGARRSRRDLNAPLLESYDYIVVGCGISGLVVINRLSEIADRTVLCIEAGDADHYEPIIQDPVYVGANVGGVYDWNLVTVPQTQLDGNPRPMPQGKVLGGGSILNAMCWNRGGADDYDAWEALGNPGWGWEGMLPYFMKACTELSETYTPVYSDEIAEEYSINYNPAVHGTSGPVQVSYPKYFYPQSVNLFAAMNQLGLATQFDPNDGTSAGPAFVPTDLDPDNQTRSDARRTYYDPYAGRSNLHVITGQHVTRILIEGIDGSSVVSNPTPGGNDSGNGPVSGDNEGFGFGPGGSTPPLNDTTSSQFVRRQDPGTSNLRITGVEFAPNGNAPRQTVYATREVIVAAGALHSAQLLQLSGFGPAALLEQFDIPIALDLPGVGNNLQDHCLVGTFYPYNNDSYPSPTELVTNATYNAEAEQEYYTQKTGPWTAGSPNALAFNPLPLITNNSAIILLNATFQAPTDFLIDGLDPTIIAGFTAQKQSLASRLARTTTAAYEIINNNAGSLTVAVMHPFSRGTCYIQSADPFEPPAIDPRWLSNPVDRQVLVEALFFNRQILATPAMAELQAAQFVPPADADEAAINQVINNGIRTEFHPSGTLAMLPLEQGGVVDSHLRVWGTQNLRVVDAGVFPLIPAAHLQAVVYGVAEKAADIIKADNLPASEPPISSTTSTLMATATPSVAANASVRYLQLLANTTADLSQGINFPLGANSDHASFSTTGNITFHFLSTLDLPTPTAGPPLSLATNADRSSMLRQSELSASTSIIATSQVATEASSTSSSAAITTSTIILATSSSSAPTETLSSSVNNEATSISSPPETKTTPSPSSIVLGSKQQSVSALNALTSIIRNPEASSDQKKSAIDAFISWVLSFIS